MDPSRNHSDQEGLNFNAVKDLLQAHQRMLDLIINKTLNDLNGFQLLNHSINVLEIEIERFRAKDKPMAQDGHELIKMEDLVTEITAGCAGLLDGIDDQEQNGEEHSTPIVDQVDKMDLDEPEAPTLSSSEEYFSKVKQILSAERQELVKKSGKNIDEEDFDNRIDVISELSDILRFQEEFGNGAGR